MLLFGLFKKDLLSLLDIVFHTAGEARTTIDTGTDTAADTCLRQRSGFANLAEFNFSIAFACVCNISS